MEETLYNFLSCNNVLCIGRHDKKHFILLSTEGSSKMITYKYKQITSRTHNARISEGL